jgi:hypothetical protein
MPDTLPQAPRTDSRKLKSLYMGRCRLMSYIEMLPEFEVMRRAYHHIYIVQRKCLPLRFR